MKTAAALKEVITPQKVLTVAVAGNPNAGKSTLINALAGTRLQVGNWPGVTVEKKEAVLEYQGQKIRLVDLPGTYSLSPYSEEERIARDYLLYDTPDVIVDVIDATNLERNLYLTMQLLELGIPVVAALNIYDEAENKGYRIETRTMEEMLGAKVIPTVATRKRGLDDLLAAVVEAGEDAALRRPRKMSYGEDLEAAATEVENRVHQLFPHLAARYPSRWLALKLLESDRQVLEEINLGDARPFEGAAVRHLQQAHGEDLESLLADARYAQAAGLTREVLRKPAAARVEMTEKIDRVVLHRFLGIPIFLAAMWLVFKLTFDVSSPFADWLDKMINGPGKRWIGALLGLIQAPDWLVSLATDGVVAGTGFVLVFVPVIFAMMFFITFLEASGYMARAAFVMDRAMHAMGLHGKSFIPMLLGFGCNVPAIYATRTLENPQDKVLTALLVPLMSCGARLPVYVLFVGAFFAAHSGTVIWSLYVLGIVLAVLVGILFKRTLFRGEYPLFIMELPPYRLPGMRSLLIHTWEKGKHFLIKAGTYILAVSVLTWFLLNLPWGVEHKQDSYLGQAGAVMAPVLKPLGFGNWEAAAALITGVIAKEIVVGTMGEIYLPKKEEKKEEAPTLGEDLKEIGVSFLGASKEAALNVFSSLMVVAVAFRHEFGSWKWFGLAFAYGTALAWVVSFIIYQGGKLLGWGG
ncbi:MAG: ferrous iron transport protein B [Deltaproteobacteria bacterium]|nr:ferrous iron transport protein B [Deltaproteobacteria bacterium]